MRQMLKVGALSLRQGEVVLAYFHDPAREAEHRAAASVAEAMHKDGVGRVREVVHWPDHVAVEFWPRVREDGRQDTQEFMPDGWFLIAQEGVLDAGLS